MAQEAKKITKWCSTCYEKMPSDGSFACRFCLTYSCAECVIGFPSWKFNVGYCMDCIKSLNASAELEAYTKVDRVFVTSKVMQRQRLFDRLQEEHEKFMIKKARDAINALMNQEVDAIAFSWEIDKNIQTCAFRALYACARIIIPSDVFVISSPSFKICFEHRADEGNIDALRNGFSLKLGQIVANIDRIDTKTFLEPEILDPCIPPDEDYRTPEILDSCIPSDEVYHAKRIGLIQRVSDPWRPLDVFSPLDIFSYQRQHIASASEMEIESIFRKLVTMPDNPKIWVWDRYVEDLAVTAYENHTKQEDNEDDEEHEEHSPSIDNLSEVD